MGPKSQTLFHFTKSLEFLQGIVTHGFWPRYSVEDCHWTGNEELAYLAFPMVCFCDIPLSRIDEHVKFYGSYGIGMTKEWALKNEMNPVLYVGGSNPLKSALFTLWDHLPPKDFTKGSPSQVAVSSFVDLMSFIKPIEGTTVVGGTPVVKDFYSESEWRHIAKHDGLAPALLQESFKDPSFLAGCNERSKRKCLQFELSDVKYIFVRKDSEIPGMIDFLQASTGRYPNNEVKVLMSRVTSLDSIRGDL